MKNNTQKLDIDLVYLWVDGSDPVWQAKRNAFVENLEENTSINCKGRYADNDELKYSLRSVEKYAPWIRKIFIVTDDQTPNWLDTANPKISVVNHLDILPEKSLPCFNSRVIESYLYKIPNLSEHFLYANDDMFFGAVASPDFFFKSDGFPIVRLIRKPWGKWHYRAYCLTKILTGKKPGQYPKTIADASLLVEKNFKKHYSGIPHHNIDAYRKVDFREAMEVVFRKQAEKSSTHHIRSMEDLQRSVILYYALATGRGHLKYIKKHESMRIPAQSVDFMKRLIRYQPELFCLNDGQRVNDGDRERIKPFLEELFPEKSSFEK